jgi:hypothetical protein
VVEFVRWDIISYSRRHRVVQFIETIKFVQTITGTGWLHVVFLAFQRFIVVLFRR